jgi:hypothetical protein
MITSYDKYKMVFEEVENIYMINGILVINKEITNQETIYSRIRSLKGVTILTINDEINKTYMNQNRNNYRINLTIKIDKYPYENNENIGFDLKIFISSLLKINGIINFYIK